MIELSIVIPFLNEESSLPELLRLVAEQPGLPVRREVIFVSDGSTDSSISIVKQASDEDSRIKLIELSRNFGHQAAVSAGLDHACGEYVAVMDADLQDEPQALAIMYDRARSEGWDVVYATRGSRQGSWLKKVCYLTFYRVYSLLSETPVNMDSGDFCVMSRRTLECLRQLPERVRFHRGLRSWIGLRQVANRVERPARFAGEAQYTWRGLLNLGLMGLTSFSIRPLRLASLAGFGLCALSVLGAVGYATYALLYDVPSLVPGFTTIVCLLLFLNGALMVQLGILGEYLGCMFIEVKRRPSYLVASYTNVDGSTIDSVVNPPPTVQHVPAADEIRPLGLRDLRSKRPS